MERRITALKVQKRNKNRVSVYLDGEYALGLSRIIAAWLSIGQEISDEKIKELQSDDAIETAHQLVLNLINYRIRSSKEIEQYLKKKGIAVEVIAEEMVRLQQSGLVDDESFSRLWVENRLEFRPRSRRVLMMELRQKGVSNQLIQETLETLEPEEDLAYRAAVKYARKLEESDKGVFRQRLGGYLARKGFSYDVSRQVIERIWQGRGSKDHPEC
jgi:regulatory protein